MSGTHGAGILEGSGGGEAVVLLGLPSTILLLYSAATTTVSGHPDPVLDTDGNPVKSGVRYYIAGDYEGESYRLHPITLNDERCRRNLILVPGFGGDVMLFGKEVVPAVNETIHVNENVSISSPILNSCNNDWWIDRETRLVTVGDDLGNEHAGLFRIVSAGTSDGHYNIEVCSGHGFIFCLPLGVKEQLLVGVNPTPLIVQFHNSPVLSHVSAAMHSTA